MAFTHSRSAMNVKLEIFEVEALIEWHHDNQYRFADDHKYRDAADSQQRRSDLTEELNQHRAGLAAGRSPQDNPEVRHD